MFQRIVDALSRAALKYPLYLFKVQYGSVNTHLIRIGSGAPQGTADARIYLNLTGTTTTTVVYVNVNGTWTALTIS